MQVIRRVGLIGDVRAEHEALGFVIDELYRRGAETVTCCSVTVSIRTT
jgi:hypothetical protein